MRRYTVLRDLGRSATGEPFGGAFATALRFRATTDTPPAVRVDVEQLDKRDVLALGRDPDVRGLAPVMPTTLIQPVDVDSGAEATTAWGIAAVGADRTARTGSGVTVAVLDTGIDAAHDAFAGVTLVQEDFSGSGNGDKAGHGTHCAGTVFGRDVGGTRIGVATGVERALIGKVLGDNGGGDSDMLFRGIHWAVSEGARVISMSLGFDFPGLVDQLVGDGVPADLATSMALEAYRANLRVFDSLMQLNTTQEPFGRGAVVVAAAGNESRRNEDPDHEIAVSIPAAAEGVVSVGALAETSNGLQVAPFSNTFPQVSGPGVGVLSARIGGGLHPLNGTSMATPHAAGVAALWWEELMANGLPATATAVRAKLLASAANAGFAAGVDVADRGLGIVQAP